MKSIKFRHEEKLYYERYEKLLAFVKKIGGEDNVYSRRVGLGINYEAKELLAEIGEV